MSNTLVRRTSRVGTVLVFMLIFGVVLGVLPAIASAAATARVSIHNLLAGQTKTFTVNVVNSEPTGLPGGTGLQAGKTINEVRIRGPVDLIDAVVAGSTGPAAFSNITLIGSPPAEIRFQVPAGETTGIVPGGTAQFNVVADVRDTLIRDRNDVWRVRVSSDRGNTHQAATSTGEGLVTNVRVLQVQNVSVVSPSGAADDRDGDGNPEVTGTQSNVCVRTRVFNAAATALAVSPALSGSNTNVGPARPATPATPCSAAPLVGGSASILPDTAQEFDFLVSFNNVSSPQSAELTGTATAPSSSTPNTPDPDDDDFIVVDGVVIEPKSVLNYDPLSLTPRAVVPSDLTLTPPFENFETFSIGIDKGPSGSPPLQTANGQFESAFCDANRATPAIEYPVAGALTFAGGSETKTVAFGECFIPDIEDDRYQPAASFGYTDANGLIQGLTALTPSLDKVRLDSLIPEVDIDIVPPPVEVTAVPPVEPAVTNGEAFSATGSVTDRSPDTDQQAPCGPNQPGSTTALPCTLEAAELVQYPLTALQGGGVALARRINVKPDCTLSSSGGLSCNINLNGTGTSTDKFDTGVFATKICATVKDETGSIGIGCSALIDVDIIDPFIDTATTARGGTVQVGNQTLPGQRRTVVVQFNEAVQDSNNPQDWIVQDGSTKTVCNVSQSADMKTVTLTTCQEVRADAIGTVDYNPSLPTSSPYHDRVGEETAAPVSEPLLDGIAPLAPVISEVNGRVLQEDAPNGDKFFFNTATPQVKLIQTAPATAEDPAIGPNYIVEVYEESDGQAGLNRLTDNQICGDAEDATSDGMITLNCDFGPGERESKVYALSVDANSNVGDLSTAQFVLDTTRPILEDVAVNGTQITVDFSERVPRGADATGNWSYFANIISDPGQRTSPDVETVSAGSTTAQRVIGYDDQHHPPADLDPDELRYHHSNGDLYEDRAGNTLLDVIFVI